MYFFQVDFGTTESIRPLPPNGYQSSNKDLQIKANKGLINSLGSVRGKFQLQALLLPKIKEKKIFILLTGDLVSTKSGLMARSMTSSDA